MCLIKNIAIEIKNFSKKYSGNKNYAVKNASFSVKKGEFHGFIGANGAGKTTTIKSIISAYAKFEGEIEIFGKNYKSLEAKKHIGYIPEKANFPKGISLYRYLKYMGLLSGLTMKESKFFSLKKINEFNLMKFKNKSPNTFSSGQKKKVLLAQALATDPDILIMDEPAANLDPKARKEFFNELWKMRNMGKTIFISSHILTELELFATSVTILDNGKVVYSGNIKSASNLEKMMYTFNIEEKSEDFFEIILKTNKIEYSNNSKNIFLVHVKNSSNLELILSNSHKEGIKIKEFFINKLSLQNIYDKYVVEGVNND